MKKIILPLLMLVVLLTQADAQDVKVIPSYWVVETNVNQKNFSIVRLYDSQNKLVHEIRMDGIYFDVSKTKHRKKLDQLIKGYYPLMSKKIAKTKVQNAKHSEPDLKFTARLKK